MGAQIQERPLDELERNRGDHTGNREANEVAKPQRQLAAVEGAPGEGSPKPIQYPAMVEVDSV